ncbi:MAG: phosphatase PAP2 family protein [Odoribacteraceae bacterium]|jgi:membrane-associated phospholipid phosphatase|nr:phosphatase PAP2 family protein [Odoribacteraceae bacterium]
MYPYRYYKHVVRVIAWTLIATLSPRPAVAASDDGPGRFSPAFSSGQLVVPAALVAYGTIEAIAASRVHLLNYAVGHGIILHPPAKIRANDFTQYLPAVAVYALDLAGIKGKHSRAERNALFAMSAFFTLASVNALKYTTREERPDRSARNSFPSGHTAVAFASAEFLWQEYKDVSIWYGIAGYIVATFTGACRVYNNKHWVGDVLAGAGLGMLNTKLAYWLYPSIRNALERKREPMIFIRPFFNGKQVGVSCSLRL